MADIHIERAHAFGLARARVLAAQWTAEAESRFGMRCRTAPGTDGDTVHFERAGVTGTVRVAADRFTLDATLGFLLGAFSRTIEAEIVTNLDALLAGAAPVAQNAPARPPGPATKKKAAPRLGEKAAKTPRAPKTPKA